MSFHRVVGLTLCGCDKKMSDLCPFVLITYCIKTKGHILLGAWHYFQTASVSLSLNIPGFCLINS